MQYLKIYHANPWVVRVIMLFKFLKSVHFWQSYGLFYFCISFLVKSSSEPPFWSLSMSVNFLVLFRCFDWTIRIKCWYDIYGWGYMESVGVIPLEFYVQIMCLASVGTHGSLCSYVKFTVCSWLNIFTISTICLPTNY